MYVSTLDKFSQLNAKKEVMKMYQCPDCPQRFKKVDNLLMVDKGPSEYSEWFWDQVFTFKCYSRVSWEKLKKRVRELGFSDTFWEVWRKRKEARKEGRV